MLGVVVSVLVVVCKRMQQLPTIRSNKQQGLQTDATCKIQQCWELLANNVASVCRGALVVSYSYISFDAIRSRNTIKSIKFCRVIDISPYYLHFFLLKLLGLLNQYNNDQPALDDHLAIPTPGWPINTGLNVNGGRLNSVCKLLHLKKRVFVSFVLKQKLLISSNWRKLTAYNTTLTSDGYIKKKVLTWEPR